MVEDDCSYRRISHDNNDDNNDHDHNYKNDTNIVKTATFQRLARKDITLSDGTLIPNGTMVFIPAFAIANDPNLYSDPSTFDGLRFYNLRQRSTEENNNKYQFTTINREQMQFGMGRHACSGRWMASYQIKLALAALITKYEFKLMDSGRPKNTGFMTNLHPDLKGQVLFKERNRS
jgi:cytochrome P450